MSKTYKILSIDGGGIRGIIPAIFLAELERRTGKSIVHLFDLIAGSSTGGMLAMGLVKPDEKGSPANTAEDLAMLYEREGNVIFSRSVWRAVTAANNITNAKYPADGIEDALMRTFGECTLSDALGDILITSYEIQRRRPWFFRSFKAKQSRTCDFKMRDVIRATTAAPTIFEPAQVFHPEEPEFFALIDGSMTANNPALCAYVEARSKHNEYDNFLVVSLGTGDISRPLQYNDARQWGLAGWSQHIMEIAFDATASTVDYQLRHLIPKDKDGKPMYYRFQTRLIGANEDLDDVTPKNIENLKRIAGEMVDKHDSLIDQVVSQLLL